MTDDLCLTLLATPAAAGLARTFITQRLTKWNLAHLLDDVLLIASELIVNACEAAPGTRLKFRLGRNSQGVFLAVWDNAPGLPQARPSLPLSLDDVDRSPSDFDQGGGWGLPIVTALATATGVHLDDRGGKWVWATRQA